HDNLCSGSKGSLLGAQALYSEKNLLREENNKGPADTALFSSHYLQHTTFTLYRSTYSFFAYRYPGCPNQRAVFRYPSICGQVSSRAHSAMASCSQHRPSTYLMICWYIIAIILKD